MTTIYVLKLEQNKYYIGKTNDLQSRIEHHFNDEGSEWTRRFKPIENNPIETFNNCDDYDEDKITLKYMGLYGIRNVRGGSFCEIELDERCIFTINKMIRGASNKCYFCGDEGHFINDCPNKNYDYYVYQCPFCDKEFESEQHLINHDKYCQDKKDCCYKCFRKGHWGSNCFAKTNKYGEKI